MQPAILCLFFLAVLAASGQSVRKGQPKISMVANPECAQRAICFSGEVREGEQFRKALNAELDFVLRIPGGIDVVSRLAESKCNLSLWIANPPLMAHHDTEIDAGYDWTAEQEIQVSVREFKIIENCEQFLTLYELVYDSAKSDVGKYLQNVETLKGRGRLWITGSRVNHSREGDDRKSVIEWLKFSVEIKLPDS